jgi:hemerythrin
MTILWRPTMAVGNDHIDADHQHLLFLINAAEAALGPEGDRQALTDALERLHAYTHEHFAREEMLMKAIRFPRYVDHRIAHRKLIERLDQLSAEFHASKAGAASAQETQELTGLLRSWLIDHVLKEDLLMKPLLKGLPADFRP